MKSHHDAYSRFERLRTSKDERRFDLTVYITGATARSLAAVANIEAFCQRYIEGRFRLKVVDVYQSPWLARDDQIVAAPTLVKSLPLPRQRVIGDLSDHEKLRACLGVVSG